jgi:hypothetical protein
MSSKFLWLSSTPSFVRYRYLPPPIIKILDSKSAETAKQAAMITTALTWILNKLPVKLLPPQLRPAVMLAKKLIPFTGYIGAAIAWSWSSIKGLDKGAIIIDLPVQLLTITPTNHR